MNVTVNYRIDQIASITKGKLVRGRGRAGQLPVPANLSLDSRKIVWPPGTIFFAIKTASRDASSYIDALYQRGVRNFVTSGRKVVPVNYPLANFIVVRDSLRALQMLAAFHRERFAALPVIGITGSNGKTVVKEWLNQLLEQDEAIVRSPKSYNSQIGVPLSVLNIAESHTLGIFEAGISTRGEMERLQKIIRPTIGVLTNIGQAHDEGFESTKEKITEKLLLFKQASTLVYCSDQKMVKGIIQQFKTEKNPALELFSWGKSGVNRLQIRDIRKQSGKARIDGLFENKRVSITIPFSDEASVENAVHCWCILLMWGKSPVEIRKKFAALYPIAMRLELKKGINHCSVINDTYSNDLHSLEIATGFLDQQRQHPKHTIFLSDMLQTGKQPQKLYQEVAQILRNRKVDRLISIGPQISAHQQYFEFIKEKNAYPSVEEFFREAHQLHFSGEAILIKGARSFGFERITRRLEQKTHQTVLSINLNAIVDNYKYYHSLLRPRTKVMAMVKAFSYGSGGYEIASVLQYHQVDYLAVAYTDEGVELRKAGIRVPIMVMNADVPSFESIVEHHLEPEIFSFQILNEFLEFLQFSGVQQYPVHIKIDTGMHRLGFLPEDMGPLTRIIAGSPLVRVESVFSHLVASENPKEYAFTMGQARRFRQCCGEMEKSLNYKFLKHIANTSAISRYRGLQMDMVRLGIGLYGIDHHPRVQAKLKNVSTLTTTISQIKKVEAGASVGYGRKARLERDSVIATVRIGYADGYPRNLSNGAGKMLVGGSLVPIVGNICMDMTMLDITGIQGVHAGDEVTVFGEALPLSTVARWAETIPYEIMTGISQRVTRVYFEQ